jgi:hypothetical protein
MIKYDSKKKLKVDEIVKKKKLILKTISNKTNSNKKNMNQFDRWKKNGGWNREKDINLKNLSK